jgi:hypothetical protein
MVDREFNRSERIGNAIRKTVNECENAMTVNHTDNLSEIGFW